MSTIERLLLSAAVVAVYLVASGHVGSPNVHFDGKAGPYDVRVIVRPPEVIPGQAEITVRVAGEGVRSVSVQPVRWDLGTAGAPRPDPAAPVAGETGLYTSQLWLMDFGSYSVHVAVEGEAGPGKVIVPVAAMATRVESMPAALGVGLAGLGLFLVIGLLTLVGAAVREAVLPPGESPDRTLVRRSWVARAVAVPVLALMLFGGARWWDAEEADYGENLYRPPAIATRVEPGESGRVLTLAVDGWASTGGGTWSPLLPDHGKLMHMFLVREPGLDAFAHVHPTRVDSTTFRLQMPPLPEGRYRLYADIVHESGFTQTLTDTVAVPSAAAGERLPSDPDDSWSTIPVALDDAAALADGSTLTWVREPEPLTAGREATLRFRVTDPDGAPARLEPYMGMLSHAAVTRRDGSVFVHLHPSGTVSMSSQQLFEQRERGDTARSASGELVLRENHSVHAGHGPGVAFPFAFPKEGRYRIWVQVKRAGRVLTGSFDATVH